MDIFGTCRAAATACRAHAISQQQQLQPIYAASLPARSARPALSSRAPNSNMHCCGIYEYNLSRSKRGIACASGMIDNVSYHNAIVTALYGPISGHFDFNFLGPSISCQLIHFIEMK